MPNMATLRRWSYTPPGIALIYYSGILALDCAVILLLWVLTHPQ